MKCTDLGIHVSEHPPITIPEPRVTFTEVPGRPGSLTTIEDIDVYEDMVLPVTCFIENTGRINEIAGYLKGAGRVVFANRQDGFYYARIVNQIPFEQILRGRPNKTFTVKSTRGRSFCADRTWMTRQAVWVIWPEYTGTVLLCRQYMDDTPSSMGDRAAARVICKITDTADVEKSKRIVSERPDRFIPALRAAGLSIRQISRLTGISYGIVRKY